MSEIRNWWNRFTRAWYLIGRHAGVDLRSLNTVRCQICQQDYDSYGTGGTVQGHDICAESYSLGGRWMIVCGYGSDFDMHEFWYLQDFPTEPIDGICDWCIRAMLRDGIIMDSGKDPVL